MIQDNTKKFPWGFNGKRNKSRTERQCANKKKLFKDSKYVKPIKKSLKQVRIIKQVKVLRN